MEEVEWKLKRKVHGDELDFFYFIFGRKKNIPFFYVFSSYKIIPLWIE